MKFLTRSALVLLVLYGLVFVIINAFLVRQNAPSWAAVLFTATFILGQFFLASWIIERVFSIDWDETEIPAANREFVEDLCRKHGLPLVRLGVIHSATPNAFSFGRFRKDARVVITRGLLEILSVDEANAVLAHEVGHVAHYDFAVMTLASAVPLLLYQLYVWGNRVKEVRAVAWCAFGAYFVSQFLVLTLNRTREFWADHFSAECTHAPNELSSALVKIAHGMVTADGEFLQTLKDGSKDEKKAARREQHLGGALALLGISNLKSGASLALAMASPTQAAAVMQWDLVNPWARLYEMSSTHPLTALRVKALNATAEQMRLPVGYPLPSDQRIRWASFPLQVLIWVAPITCVGFAVVANTFFASGFAPWLILVAGITWAIRTAFRYRGNFVPRQIGILLEDLEVSQMTPRARRTPRPDRRQWCAGGVLERRPRAAGRDRSHVYPVPRFSSVRPSALRTKGAWNVSSGSKLSSRDGTVAASVLMLSSPKSAPP